MKTADCVEVLNNWVRSKCNPWMSNIKDLEESLSKRGARWIRKEKKKLPDGSIQRKFHRAFIRIKPIPEGKDYYWVRVSVITDATDTYINEIKQGAI